MRPEEPRPDSRHAEILRNAIEAFAAYGVRGASLRDIAKRAGVSLTLISHHFGNKPSLLGATTDAVLKAGTAPLSRLRAELWNPPSSSSEVVAAWMRYLQAAFGTPSKLPHLRLIHRLRGDPDVEEIARGSLDAAEPILRDALCRLYPSAPRTSVDLVLQSARAALIVAMLHEGSARDGRHARAGLDEQSRELVERFAAGAMDAALAAGGEIPGAPEVGLALSGLTTRTAGSSNVTSTTPTHQHGELNDCSPFTWSSRKPL